MTRGVRRAFLTALIAMTFVIQIKPATVHAAGIPLATNPLKLFITQEGIVSVTAAYLTSHGVDLTNVPVATLGLSDNGTPTPISVTHAGSLFGQSGSDSITFYAHPINNTYATTNVYVLADNVSSPALVQTAPAGTASSPTNLMPSTYRDEQRTTNESVPFPGESSYKVDDSWPADGDDHWIDAILLLNQSNPSASTSLGFSLGNLPAAPSGSCTLSMSVLGLAYAGNPVGVPFQVGITVNGHPLDHSPYNWASQWPMSGGDPAGLDAITDTFPCSVLSASNTVTVSSSLQSGVSSDQIWLRNYQLTYNATLCAQQGIQAEWLGPSSGGFGGNYTVGGYTGNAIHVVRITGSTVTLLTGTALGTNPCGSGSYGLQFADTPSAATYLAYSQTILPAAISALDMTNITSGGSTSGQYLIVTNPAFAGSNCGGQGATPLCTLISYHQNQGLSVKQVSVNTIFDQYSGGQVDPEAIRSYVQYAVSHLGTQYVLLVGGDTLDYHNYFNCPTSGQCLSNPTNQSFIPSLYVSNQYWVGTSDNQFAVPLGATSPAPDVAIGRLPVLTTTQLQTEVTKSVNWAIWAQGYAGTASFAAGWEDPEFQPGSNQMIADLPTGFHSSTFYETSSPSGNQTNRADFLASFSSGPEIVNYVGHGNLTQWSNTPLFMQTDVANLTDLNKPSMVFQWDCDSASYTVPTINQVDPSLLNATAGSQFTGAALVIGSTGVDAAYPQIVLAGGTPLTGPTGVHYFYGYLTQHQTIGMALMKAKDDLMAVRGLSRDTPDVVSTYTILGDPLLPGL